VGVGGDLSAQGLDQLDLPCRRGEEVGAAHHFADLHGEIVDHHRQLVGVEAVPALEDEIAHRAVDPLLYQSLHQVDEADRAVVDEEAEGGVGVLRPGQLLVPVGLQVAGPKVGRVGGESFRAVGGRGQALQVAARPAAGEEPAAGGELGQGLFVETAALRL